MGVGGLGLRKSTTSTKSLTSKTSKSKKLVTAKTHSKSNEGSSKFVLPQAATAVTNHQEAEMPKSLKLLIIIRSYIILLYLIIYYVLL